MLLASFVVLLTITASEASEKPHIIFFLADDLGKDFIVLDDELSSVVPVFVVVLLFCCCLKFQLFQLNSLVKRCSPSL